MKLLKGKLVLIQSISNSIYQINFKFNILSWINQILKRCIRFNINVKFLIWYLRNSTLGEEKTNIRLSYLFLFLFYFCFVLFCWNTFSLKKYIYFFFLFPNALMPDYTCLSIQISGEPYWGRFFCKWAFLFQHINETILWNFLF